MAPAITIAPSPSTSVTHEARSLGVGLPPAQLDLPVRYFELLMQRMESDPRIGTTTGKPWFVHPQSGALAREVCGDEMSVGMTKLYGVACFREIGGFVRQVMWDGIDCHRARMLGWIAESIDHEPLRFVHLRPQGASQKGIWTGRLRKGFWQYFMGTSPFYYLAVRYLSPADLPGAVRQCGHAVGLPQELAQGSAALRRPRVQTLPPLLPARLPAYGQAGCHGPGQYSSGPASGTPATRLSPDEAR